MKLTDLYTRDTANAGRKAIIPGRDGRPTGEWFLIHHPDCDEFRARKAALLTRTALIGEDVSQEDRQKMVKEWMAELAASLVSGWSLEDPFAPESAADLLRNAPYLMDWLDRETGDTAAFFGGASTG